MTRSVPRSALLRAYLGATSLVPALLLRPLLRAHAAQGGDPARISERHGHATRDRPPGALFWFHAASVGEFIAIRDLLSDFGRSRRGATFLVTTNTTTGARAVASAAIPNTIHQYLPADTPEAVTSFLDHWHPELAVIVESDIWPRLAISTWNREIPIALINARASRTRSRLRRTMSELIGLFDLVATQDETITEEFAAMGYDRGRILTAGDVKADADPLPDHPTLHQNLKLAIGNRPVWAAVSTHPADEGVVIDAHKSVLQAMPGTLLILVPRHPDRAAAIKATCDESGLTARRRSDGGLPSPGDKVFLVDTIGETGVVFRLAPVVFLGGSFGDEGGHNPYEPICLGAVLLHGPNVRHFKEPYLRFDHAGAAIMVNDATELARRVSWYLTATDERDHARSSGASCLASMAGARSKTLAALLALVPGEA